MRLGYLDYGMRFGLTWGKTGLIWFKLPEFLYEWRFKMLFKKKKGKKRPY